MGHGVFCVIHEESLTGRRGCYYERVEYSNAPIPKAGMGLQTILDGVSRAFSSPDASIATLSFINTFLNACIGLLITVAIVTFFTYLACWMFGKTGSELSTVGKRGAMRAFTVLFLMINIWFIIRLLDGVVALSNVVAYAVFFFTFLLLGFWSLFGVGDASVRLLSRAADWLLDIFVMLARRVGAAAGESRSALWLQKADQRTLRFCAFVVLALILTPLSFIDFSTQATSDTSSATSTSAWSPLGEANNTLPLTFPPDWKVTSGDGTSSLLFSAEHASSTFSLFGSRYSGPLAGGGALPSDQLSYLTDNLLYAYLDSGWSLQNFSIDYNVEVENKPAYIVSFDVNDPQQPSSQIAQTSLIFGSGTTYYILSLATPLDGVSDKERLDFDSKSWRQVFNTLPEN